MKSYKTEIKLTNEQKIIYARTVGTCRYVYNLFIARNKERHENGQPYINNYEFSKWLNNEYLPNNPDKSWIKEASSKAVRNAIDNAHKAFKRFFDKQGKFPRFKKKGKNDCNYYFVRTSKTQPIHAERHKIKIPCMGDIRLKEYGYIPIKSNIITSGTVSKQADRYYISVTTDEIPTTAQNNTNEGIGIDLGVKDFAVLSTKTVHKTKKQKKLKKKLKREQRKLSRKYEKNKTKIKKGESTKGIEKQKTVVAKIHQKIANVREDYQNKIVNEIVKTKPSYITIEDLNVIGMMKNRHLSEAIANQGFNMFVKKLTYKASINGIEIRQVDRFYPSSKKCSNCGIIKADLNLSDRIYQCNSCGLEIDRDINAAINLKNAEIYRTA